MQDKVKTKPLDEGTHFDVAVRPHCNYITLSLQFNSHKPVQKLFHNLHIIFSKSLMGFKVICQLEKEPLKGLVNVQEIVSLTISLLIDLQ